MSGERLIPDFGPDAPERPVVSPPPAPPDAGDGSEPGGPPSPFEPPALAAYARQQPPPEEPKAKRSTPYDSRFQLILGALLGVAAVAIVAALAIGTGPGSKGDSGRDGWAVWKPSSGDTGTAAQEIANHVAPQYRLDNGQQLVTVVGGKPQVAELPVNLAVGGKGGAIQVLSGNGVMYSMCGLGKECSIATGKPSYERSLLLRREALEMALYSFKNIDDLDYVVAMLPPHKPPKAESGAGNGSSGSGSTSGSGSGATTPGATTPSTPGSTAPKVESLPVAMLFLKSDLERLLDQPLTSTLPTPTPTVETLDPPDVASLQAMTEKLMVQYQLQQGANGDVLMVLVP